jgi:hypothetical protein
VIGTKELFTFIVIAVRVDVIGTGTAGEVTVSPGPTLNFIGR